MNANIRTFLDLSTGHLTPSTRQRLEDGEGPFYTMTGEFGWFIYVGESSLADDMPDLVACLDKARSLGAEYILFDADGPVHDGLPTYDD